MSKKFTVEYFIKKFEAIHDGLWTTGRYQYNGACCGVVVINDGNRTAFQQSTPKARIDPSRAGVDSVNQIQTMNPAKAFTIGALTLLAIMAVHWIVAWLDRERAREMKFRAEMKRDNRIPPQDARRIKRAIAKHFEGGPNIGKVGEE